MREAERDAICAQVHAKVPPMPGSREVSGTLGLHRAFKCARRRISTDMSWIASRDDLRLLAAPLLYAYPPILYIPLMYNVQCNYI